MGRADAEKMERGASGRPDRPARPTRPERRDRAEAARPARPDAAKYLSGQSEIVIPAPLDQALAAQVRALAAVAFRAVDGAGLARADFLLDKESGALWINEVNTLPGFTPVSMYAQMWAASGLAYPALLDRLIELGLERHQQKQPLARQ